MSSTGEEKRREEYTYTYIRIRTKTKLTLYLPETFLPTEKKLEELLRIDGISLSDWYRQNANEYVRLHEPGNPQRPMTIFTGEVKKSDPFGCGMVKAVSADNRWVNCLVSQMKKPRVFCEQSCARRKRVKGQG